jgi:hypothetical protein
MPLVDTLGVMLLSDTDLEEFECDPRMIDLVITPEALKNLRNVHKRQEIENKTMPSNDRKELVTAKTVLGDSYEDDDVGSVIGKMKEMALLKERQSAAREKNQGILKKIQEVEGPEYDNLDLINDRRKVVMGRQEAGETPEGRLLGEVDPEDSMSMVGDSNSDVSRAVKNAKTHQVGFMVD